MSSTRVKGTPAQGRTPNRSAKTCTWEELGTHATESDCWIAVDGKVYDVTSWLPTHPGGKDLLLLSSGRDVTNLFQSYHPLTQKPAQILKKYYVCDMSNSEFPNYTTKSAFYETVRTRVCQYFQENNIDPQSSWRIYSRMMVVYLGLFITYYLTHYVSFSSILVPLLFAFLFGVFEGLTGLHILHDSSHAAVSHYPSVWKWMGSSFDFLIGASFFAWIHQHILGHHLFTNVRGADPDLGDADVDFRRISPHQPALWFHRYQYIYAPFLYGLLAFKYRLQDSVPFLSGLNGRVRVTAIPTFYILAFFIGKAIFITARLVVPLFFMSLGRVMILFFISEFVMGYYLAINFQVSHIAEGMDFYNTPPPPSSPKNIDNDWAVLQVRTTQDYAHGKYWTSYFAGGLNYQVVHHLFPTISQTYYPEIAPIVVKTCKEYGIPYIVLPSFTSAFVSHIKYLYLMGTDDRMPKSPQKKKM